jgi:hypothetical protein
MRCTIARSREKHMDKEHQLIVVGTLAVALVAPSLKDDRNQPKDDRDQPHVHVEVEPFVNSIVVGPTEAATNNTARFFGFDDGNPNVAGFDIGLWK